MSFDAQVTSTDVPISVVRGLPVLLSSSTRERFLVCCVVSLPHSMSFGRSVTERRSMTAPAAFFVGFTVRVKRPGLSSVTLPMPSCGISISSQTYRREYVFET